MQNVPSAPYPADGSCSADQNNFYYIPSDDYSTYSLSFCLGSGVSDLSEGPKCLTPGGIINFDCSGDGNEENENNENTANVCPQECDFGYICQSGSCVVNTFQCGQNVSYNGYSYPTVEIGTQCWFKENLRTDKFKNGDSIPNVTTQWNVSGGVGPAWCAYNNDINNETNYGKLYSSYAVLDSRGLCPDGWRVPSQTDFDNLVSAATPYNGFSLHSCRMVNSPLGGSCATDQHPRWNYSSAYTGTDIFGFSALPGGYKYGATFYNLGVSGHFWTTTPYQTTRLYDGRAIYDNANGFLTSIGDTYFTSARSVRCIKN